MMQLECSNCSALHHPTPPAAPTPNEPNELEHITSISFTAAHLVNRAIGMGHCVFCRLIFTAVCEVLGQGREPTEVHNPIVVERHDIGESTGPLVIQFGPASARREVQVYTQLKAGRDEIHEIGDSSPWKAIGQGFDVPLEALDDSCTWLARAWLNSCTDPKGDHHDCQPPPLTPELPSRVIDVDIGGLNLVDTLDPKTGERKRGEYVALSYYWGKDFPLPTTKENLDLRLRSRLPTIANLFSDAYDFTRAMGVRYLWMDALCLAADDEMEQDREISRMGEIYENALFTISADASHTPHGFLRSPNRQIRPRYYVDYLYVGAELSSFKHGAVWVRERGRQSPSLPLHDFPPRDSASLDPIITKLQTRAWAFQERVLAARTLHFGKTEFGWECRSTTTCQCSANNVRPVCQKSLIKARMAELGAGDSDDAERCWRDEVVPDYTRRDIFRPAERLLAISGLAGKFSQLRQGEAYHTGLWASSLAKDLLWQASFERASVRQATYIAPSWSWASITGAVSYSFQDGTDEISPAFQIRGIDVKHAGTVNRFGNAKLGARLRVRGVCLPAFYHPYSTVKPETREVEFNEHNAPGIGVVGHDSANGWSEGDYAFRPVWDTHKLSLEDGSNTEFLVLLVSESEVRPLGLVLKRTTLLHEDGQPVHSAVPAYERVGFVGRRQTGKPNRFATAESGLNDPRPKLMDEEIQEKKSGATASWRYWESLGNVMEIDLV